MFINAFFYSSQYFTQQQPCVRNISWVLLGSGSGCRPTDPDCKGVSNC